MAHPLIDKILNDGVRSVNVSMLSPELRKRLMTDAATALLSRNRIADAADALAIGGNLERLREIGEWYLLQRRYPAAALFLRHVEEPERLARLAQDCLAAGDVSAARAIYESLGDETMLEFLKQNF